MRLETLPGWAWDANEAAWEEGFAQLQKYAVDHGDCIVAHSFKQDGYWLGSWVNNQRTNYTKGKVKPEYVTRLESLPGWVWEVNATKWEEGFRHLLDYTEKYGTAMVPARFQHNGYPLGSWVPKQRETYRAGNMSTERVKQLASIFRAGGFRGVLSHESR